MIMSVFWLSDLFDARVLSDVFWPQWLTGNLDKLFFELILWQNISSGMGTTG
jgi:hypothetical protein